MSTNKIDDMTERESKSLLNDICNELQIGGAARCDGLILTNLRNSIRRSECLWLIENHLTIMEDGEESSRLNWGETPEQYIETFKKAIAT